MENETKPARIALVGERNPTVVAHEAIEKCFALGRASGAFLVEPCWLPTDRLRPGAASSFDGFHGIWVVPASPYRNTAGALWAIEFARTRKLPFLGTCGGFQHALLEYARDVLGLEHADHAELKPDTGFPLLCRLRCSLVEETQKVMATGGKRFSTAYGGGERVEGFHCRYGLNPEYERLLEGHALEVVARSEGGEVRAVELRDHPFFIATLFQPERRALTGTLHPLVAEFFRACGA